MKIEQIAQILLNQNNIYNARYAQFQLETEGSGVTIPPKGAGAFTLNAPMIASLRQPELEKQTSVGVVRSYIKISDLPYFNSQNISVLVDRMEKALFRELQIAPKSLTFSRPGTNDILQLTETGDHYEIRLVALGDE